LASFLVFIPPARCEGFLGPPVL